MLRYVIKKLTGFPSELRVTNAIFFNFNHHEPNSHIEGEQHMYAQNAPSQVQIYELWRFMRSGITTMCGADFAAKASLVELFYLIWALVKRVNWRALKMNLKHITKGWHWRAVIIPQNCSAEWSGNMLRPLIIALMHVRAHHWAKEWNLHVSEEQKYQIAFWTFPEHWFMQPAVHLSY